MAHLLLMAVMLHIFKRSSQLDCEKEVLVKSFDCQCHFTDGQLALNCENIYEDNEEFSDAFFVFDLYKKISLISLDPSMGILKDLLDPPFDADSAFYSCSSMWRGFTARDPSVLAEHCKRYDQCIQLASKYDLHVKKMEISDSISRYFFDRLEEFTLINDVFIHHTMLENISELKFGNYSSLDTLKLKNNKIETLSEGIFDNMTNLEIVDLSQNRIRAISKFSFEPLVKLNSLNLSHNLITTVTSDFFSGLSSLRVLDLSNNELNVLPENSFYHLKSLEEISCSECKLTELHEGTFEKTPKITLIDFSMNEIKTIPSNTFRNQYSLINVNLNFNKLNKIPEFQNKTHMRYLQLFQNDIQLLSANLSIGAPNLYYLNISKNRIEHLSDYHVKLFRNLEYLDLSRNKISYIQFDPKQKLALRKLYLSNNLIEYLNIDWRRLIEIENIDLDYNKLTFLDAPPCIVSIKQTITFSFRHNNISKLNMKSLIKDDIIAQTDRTMAADCSFNGMPKNYIDISYNPLDCNCDLYSLHKYLNQKNGRRIASFINEGNLTCSSPSQLKNETVKYLPDDAFSCSFDGSCPETCDCGIRAKDNQIFVNCSGTGLAEAPSGAPLEATVLYFNGNNLRKIDSIKNDFWPNLTELHVDNNKLVSLEGWDIPSKVQFLSLRNNSIQYLPQTLMDFLTNQSQFELLFGGNDRNCDCNRINFKHFLEEQRNSVKDIENIICDLVSNGTTSSLALHTIPDSVLCAKIYSTGFNPKVTLISVCTMFALIIIILLTYYKQRQLILSFLYLHCYEIFHACFEENEADEDKVFDAFIAYSSSDRPIVMDMLEELEEKEPHFQLCIHERNWLPGRFISDNIINSVQSSKRTIVVLSNDFIASPWFRLEMRAAIFKVSGDKRNKLIVILADKSTTLDGIDMEIRHVISKRTYLVWGERWFWEKMRYAMPRKSCLDDLEQRQLNNKIGCKRDSEIALMESA